MTEKEVRELLQLIKSQHLFCNIELETDETYLLETATRYSSCVVHVYTDEDKERDVIIMQIDIDPKSQTYYLDDRSGGFNKDIQKHALFVSDYCKNLITRYI